MWLLSHHWPSGACWVCVCEVRCLEWQSCSVSWSMLDICYCAIISCNMHLLALKYDYIIRPDQINLLLHGFTGPILAFLKKFYVHAQMTTPYREVVTFATWAPRMTEPCSTASTKHLYFILSLLTFKVDPFISLNRLFTQLFLQTVREQHFLARWATVSMMYSVLVYWMS